MKSGIAALGPSSKSMDPSFGRAKRAVVRSDASRPGSWLRSRESTRLREKERRRDGYGVWGLVRTRSRIRALRDDSEKNVRSPSVPIFTRRRSWFSYLYPLTPYLCSTTEMDNEKGESKKTLLSYNIWAIPTLACSCPHTTIGPRRLNCRVRYGAGCFPSRYLHPE